MRIAFFDTKDYDIESFDTLVKEKNIEVKYFESKLNIDTVGLTAGFDGVCVFVNDQITKEVIDKLYDNGVKAIFLRCAGFNNVDLTAAYGKIHVYRVPAYSPYAVAEHAMALYLTSNRRIHKAFNRVREYNFSLSGLTGNDLHGKTVGVIGTGKIGRIFINICKGFGMNVIAYDLFPMKDSDINYVSLDSLFKESDVISLHCPLTPETTHIINKDSIALMKKGVAIINTSRGGLINSADLLQGIKDRKIGTVCLDVYEEEGSLFFENKSGHIMDDSTLLQLIAMPNVLITSHQAFLTKEALSNIASTTVDNMIKFFSNELNSDFEVCYRCGNQEHCAKKRNAKCF
ncbi:MAG: 2-hydroxyacid dehydrogenase [Bacilli bacterium]|nr:2-hydroxyacid dehydrogenase [Bacilli bacterium]